MKFKLAVFIILLLLSGCDKTNDNSTVDPGNSQIGPVDPIPADGSIEVDNLVSLSWTYDQADTFKVLLDTVNPPQQVAKDSLYANSLVAFAPGAGQVYYWQVIAVLSDGTEVPGDIWSFATKTAVNAEPGFEIIKHFIVREPPNRIRILFQVLDKSSDGVTNLTQNDFKFFEDGEEIPLFESDLLINKAPVEPLLNTLLMLDNSSSIGGDDPQNLPTIKNIASEVVNTMMAEQTVAVYKFSSQTEQVIDYTGITNQPAIINAINSIPLGARSTDLYGSVIVGADELVESYNEEVIQSFMLLISDGNDTQDSHTFADALDAATGKFVYTIGVGDVDVEVLYLLGNSGFYKVEQTTQIDSVVGGIQADILQLSNSFYELEYASPKRGNSEHYVELFINGNTVNSTLNATFTSAGFFDPEPGIYFNPRFSEPDGTDKVELSTNGIPVEVGVMTFGESVDNEPVYTWATDNRISYNFQNSNNSIVEVSTTAGSVSGQTISILVTDTVNGFSKTINFVIL